MRFPHAEELDVLRDPLGPRVRPLRVPDVVEERVALRIAQALEELTGGRLGVQSFAKVVGDRCGRSRVLGLVPTAVLLRPLDLTEPS